MSNNKISKWAINCACEIDPNWMNRYARIIQRHHKAHLARERKRKQNALNQKESTSNDEPNQNPWDTKEFWRRESEGWMKMAVSKSATIAEFNKDKELSALNEENAECHHTIAMLSQQLADKKEIIRRLTT